MILLSLISYTRLQHSERAGATIAFTGFVYLILPRVTTPSIIAFLLMRVAGIAWGVCILKGRDSNSPLMDTTYNFSRTTPLDILLAIIAMNNVNYSSEGIVLAMLSGSITSGLGCTIYVYRSW